MLVHWISLNWLCVHVEVPDFEWQVVACQQVAAIVTKLYIWYTRYYFWEEASISRVFRFLQHCIQNHNDKKLTN